MARNKPASSPNKTVSQTSFTFPQLHQAVSSVVSDDIGSTWFNIQAGGNFQNEYSTNVMGRFECNNNSCPNNGWGSKKVAILIRGYPNNGYNATVFNQRCQSCNQLGSLTLDNASYVERVSYRIKKNLTMPRRKDYRIEENSARDASEGIVGRLEGLD
ncbi:hypothetical protein VM1G_11789 [Cytospora mali]|uniref:3CxxC-type domain-containing protein n=1 Tax=Cytospora mali TaxID=578113 RepID=A0A194W6W0_CYTMA|nr:hypothetical protein VM1G_11789 [Valsa mali]